MKINNIFSIGQIVYVIYDQEQEERMVVHIKVTSSGILYGVRILDVDDILDFYDIELSDSKKVI
jgi:hypothetical protein